MTSNGIHFTNSSKKLMAIYCIILGIINIGIGIFQIFYEILILIGINFKFPFFISPDLFSGICLVIIGTIFTMGINPLLNKEDKGVAFLIGGILLALIMGIIYLMIMGSDWIMFLIGNDDFQSWSPLDDFVPALWASIFSIPGASIAWKIRNIK
ncbi:MAG: hypothetical protein ACTSYY_09440 [Promethearchaeota archaeon]